MARIKKQPPDLSTFAGRFKHARIKAGFSSQGKLADKLGITQQAISEWERGLAENPHHLQTAADLMEVSYDWLVYGKGEMKSPIEAQFNKLKRLSEEKRVLFETAFGDSIDAFIKKHLSEEK